MHAGRALEDRARPTPPNLDDTSQGPTHGTRHALRPHAFEAEATADHMLTAMDLLYTPKTAATQPQTVQETGARKPTSWGLPGGHPLASRTGVPRKYTMLSVVRTPTASGAMGPRMGWVPVLAERCAHVRTLDLVEGSRHLPAKGWPMACAAPMRCRPPRPKTTTTFEGSRCAPSSTRAGGKGESMELRASHTK